MSEPKEMHKVRMRIKRSHPEWSAEQVRAELKRIQEVSSQKFTRSSRNEKQTTADGSPQASSQKFTRGSRRIFLRVDHSMEKGQYVVSESTDGISFRYIGTFRKGQEIVRNGVTIIPTWHRGDGMEHGDIPPNEAKETIEKPWAREAEVDTGAHP